MTVEHVAGIPVCHPTMVAVGRHYGCKVESCVPYDPEAKGGVEATVKVAKRDPDQQLGSTAGKGVEPNSRFSCPRHGSGRPRRSA